MARTVLLRHDLPDGTHHFDWLIEPEPAGAGAADPDERALLAWRLPRRPEEAIGGEMLVERLAPHRRVYLEYEGPISGGRGVVSRVASGTVVVRRDQVREFEAVVALGDSRLRLQGEPIPGGAWRLRVGKA